MSPREKAKKIRWFVHYVDSCDDLWYLSHKDSPERKELAEVLRRLRNGTRTEFHFAKYYAKHYLDGYRTTLNFKGGRQSIQTNHYDEEFLELMNELHRA